MDSRSPQRQGKKLSPRDEFSGYFAQWLRAAWSRRWEELFEKTGLSRATISHLVNGHNVPGPATLRKLFPVLGTPENMQTVLLAKSQEFRGWKGRKRRRKPHPLCRRCGKEARPHQARRFVSYDAATNSFLCQKCRGTEIRCPDCGTIRQVADSVLKKLRTLQRRRGKLVALCGPCSGKRRGRHMWERQRLQVVAERLGGSNAAKAMIKRAEAGDERAGEEIRVMVSDAARKRGRALLNVSPEDHKARISRPRRKITSPRAQIISAVRLTNDFTQCPLCELLRYPRPETARRNRPSWHDPCWATWRRQSEVAISVWKKRNLRGDGLLVAADSIPHPPMPEAIGKRGRAHDKGDLKGYYRWLLQAGAGRGPKEIAGKESYYVTPDNVRDGIESITKLLPGSWKLVFGRRRGDAIRQEVVPLPKAIPDREGLVERLASFGMPIPDISSVVGYPIERVNTILEPTLVPK